MIYQKLLEFQKLGITLNKDGRNPHFKSEYVTLNEVLAKVKKPLNDLGVLIVQEPDEKGLWTKLVDTEDNGHIQCFVPYVNATDMQKLGGAITYARRYSLISLLGLEDEDDDGNKASEEPSPYQKAVEAIKNATTADRLNKLEQNIVGNSKFTDKEQMDLQNMIDSRAQLIPE